MPTVKATKEQIAEWEAKGLIPTPPVCGELVQEPKRPKYGNRKTEIDGFVFDSKKEALRYLDLREEQRAGVISELRRQVAFPLVVNGDVIGEYVADFTYWLHGKLRVEDVKSKATRKLPLYRLKVKLMKACLGIEVLES